MTPDCIGLQELQRDIAEGISACFPERLWVVAEVSSVQVKANGHCYLDLVESRDGSVLARAKAVIWRGRYQALIAYYRDATGGDITAGQQIMFRAQVNYSELFGLSLVIDEIEPQFTLGQAEIERRNTIEKLRSEGLLDKQQSLRFVELPYRLAVISAYDAAGYGDFCRHLEGNEFGFRFEVSLFPATMQGEGAPESIIDALESIQTAEAQYDAVLMMRGGGSASDLACFDDYGLAFSIAQCKVPVFTAIGHDRDFHVADMVAFRYVKTPTALADLMIDCYAAEDEKIVSLGNRLRMAMVSRVAALESAVDMLESRIKAADPRNILSRGYTLVTDAEGVVVKSAGSVKSGDAVRILFEDGQLEAVVR